MQIVIQCVGGLQYLQECMCNSMDNVRECKLDQES